MNRINLSFLVLGWFLLIACQQPINTHSGNKTIRQRPSKIAYASIDGLILNPKTFNHRYVHVTGYLNIGPQQNGLYLDKYDYEKSIEKNALWIDTITIKNKFPNLKRLSGKYVMIDGKFDAYNVEDMSKWGGKLTDIKKLELWNPTK